MSEKYFVMRTSKKKLLITNVFEHCQKEGVYTFHNDLVKEINKKIGLSNPFDATKMDDKSKLPQILLDNDYFLLHLGEGRHQFVKGISKGFHTFEKVTDVVDWPYKKKYFE